MTTWKHYIDFDLRDGSLSFESQPDFERGAPFDVWHHKIVRFPLPLGIEYDEDEILEWFRERYGELCEPLRDGWSEEWDGSNFVGQYEDEDKGDRALEVEMEIEELMNQDIEFVPGREISRS